ncbi:MAG: hypothetical protein KAH33_03395 [Candidatus Delongbacteria bacterium]|nr:hypothetical protein [Candidatus Delongbacteria bacterium]
MKALKNCYKFIILLTVLIYANNSYAEGNINWIDILLPDTTEYVDFGGINIDNNSYPPSNLFDGDLSTCWVSKKYSSPFIKLPEINNIVLNIFSGYGKSKELFYENSRPKRIQVNVFCAINPSGFVSECAVLYKAVKFPEKYIINLTDSFGVQSINLNITQKKISDFKKKIHKLYDSTFEIPRAETCFIIQVDILESYKGSKYDDICISEIFFNDRFITLNSSISDNIKKVYLNSDEDTLYIDTETRKEITVISGGSSFFQIIEVTKDNKWAVLISMPKEIEGRAATTYHLVDLVNKTIANSQLERTNNNYFPGNSMHFIHLDDQKNYLNYLGKDNEHHKIELK